MKHNTYRNKEELKVRVNPKGDEETIYDADEEVLNDDVLQAMMPEMQNYQRAMVSPQHVVSASDILRVNDDTLTNMTTSEPLMADGPEDGRAKSAIATTARGSDIRDKSILGNDPTGLDQGVTHSESVTGTGAIAAPPGFVAQRRKKMANNKKVVNEWSPEFVAGEYKPGDPTMPKHGGKGLADKSANELKIGKFKTETDAHGDAFGMKRKKSVGMAVANDQGLVTDPQGEHESKHGDPLADDCCDEVGHNWPAEPKHSGSISEPVSGHSYGPAAIKGGSVAEESWSPKNFAKMLGEDADIQKLFDQYAKTVPHVCKEDFQTVINANGLKVVVDDVSLNTLMAKNREFVFYANEDANGPYFTPINEMVGTGAVGYATPVEAEVEGGFAAAAEHEEDGTDEWLKTFVGDEDMDSGDAPDHMKDSMPFGLPSRKTGESIGKMLRGDGKAGYGADEEHEDKLPPPPPLEFNIGEAIGRFIHRANHLLESLNKYCLNCGSSCDGDCKECEVCSHTEFKEKPGQQRELFGESVAKRLNMAWDKSIGAINPRRLKKVFREGLLGLQQRVPGFKPLVESTAMDAPKGKGLKGGDGPKDELPDQPTEFKEVGTKDNLIKRKPVNNVEKTPTVPGTGHGMSAESIVRRNIEKIVGRVKTRIAESKLPRHSKVEYCIVVEGKRGKMRKNVGEAAADAEEMLQYYNSGDVNISAIFSNAAGSVVMRKDIPLFTIDSRGAFVSEGKAIFRNKIVAESYANKLFSRGYATKMIPHNWGFAVASNAPKTIKENWAPMELDSVPGQAKRSELGGARDNMGYTADEEMAGGECKTGYNCGYSAGDQLAAPPKAFDKDGNPIDISDEEYEEHQKAGYSAGDQLAAPPKAFDKDGNPIDISDEEYEEHQKAGYSAGDQLAAPPKAFDKDGNPIDDDEITADDLPK